MRVEFSEAQQMLRASARDFLAAECAKSRVRELEEDDGLGYSPQMWAQMAAMGWLGLVIPEQFGGEGMSFQDLTVLLEEMGRNILPGPFFCTTVTGALPVIEHGSVAQKQLMLPSIATGNSIVTLALIEGRQAYTSADVEASATRNGGRFIISGRKLFVEMAHAAGSIICAVRTREGDSPNEGVTVFIVGAQSPGIRVEVMPTMGMDKLCEVRFDDVAVPIENNLGGVHTGWPVIRDLVRKAAIAKCAESVGGMQQTFDMCLSYAREREQYGRPIGTFQVIQHWLADMYIATETARYLSYRAAWLESEGIEAGHETSLAKAYVNEAYTALAMQAVRLHGGIGTTRDHDVGLYFRRARVNSLAFGDTAYHRERVAQGLGLQSGRSAVKPVGTSGCSR